MMLAATAMASLADYREELLHRQSPAEARRMRRLGRQLRGTLRAAGLSRQQFATRTGLAIELIVGIENGYGRPESARHVLRRARLEPYENTAGDATRQVKLE